MYNAEKYVETCVASLVAQTFDDFEIILVNDGSTDGSGDICGKLSEKYENIRYISTENGGAAAARNIGMAQAKGSYFVFIDCDDYVDKMYLERLYTAVTENDADIAVCSIARSNNGVITYNSNNDKVYSKTEYITDCFLRRIEYVTVFGPCVKIISADVLRSNNITFPTEFRLSEDRIFNLLLMDKIKKAVTMSYVGYIYVSNDASLTHNKNSYEVLKNIILAESAFWSQAEILFENNGLKDEYLPFICDERRKAFLSMGALVARLKSRSKAELYGLIFDLCPLEYWDRLALGGIKWKWLKSAVKGKNVPMLRLWLNLMEAKNKIGKSG